MPPTSHIPWSSRARRFAANLATLHARNPAAAALIQSATPNLPRYHLSLSPDNAPQLLDSHTNTLYNTLNSPAAAAPLFPFNPKQNPTPFPIAFDGLSFGYLFTHILTATTHSFLTYSCALHILEPDPFALAILFHIHDLTAAIAHPRTHWHIAATPESTLQHFYNALLNTPSLSLPDRWVTNPLLPRPPLAIEPILTQLRTARDAHRQSLITQITAHYSDKTPAHYRARFNSNSPLTILGITSRYTTVLQHSMAELAAAATSLGHTFTTALEPDDHSLEHPFLDLIAAQKPDLLIQLSRLRYENPSLPKNVPFLSWDQDNLPCMRTPEATASLADLTFVAGHAAAHGYHYLDWPAKNTIPCHLAAATLRYAPRLLSPTTLQKYTCDFSYVSNASDAPLTLQSAHAARFPPEAAPFFLAFTNPLLSDPLGPDRLPWHEGTLRAAARTLVAKMNLSLSPNTLQELLLSAQLIADRAFRHQTLLWVSAFCKTHNTTLHLYGNGWHTHPALAHHAAGPATQGDELQAITQASRINLQIIGTGLLHSRLLDGIAAGGFFLVRRTHHDDGAPAFLAARDLLSTHIYKYNITSFAQLDALQSPALAAAWQTLRPTYLAQRQLISESILIRGLATAHLLPHPLTLLPELEQIGYHTEQEFTQKATHFLQNPTARTSLSTTLHTAIQTHFSYKSRLTTFLTHLQKNL